MSAIPPDIIGSSLQAGLVQREASRQTDTARTGDSQAAERQLRAVDEAASNVETTDTDERVHADAEGAGSQGRAFSEEGNQESGPGNGCPEDSGEAGGPLHLDVQA